MTARPTAAVIGGGFGGLGLACRLQAAGFDVTLLEGREKLGGRAYVYEMEGFTFDAGPTVVTDPSCIEEIFEAAGRKLSDYVELIEVDPLYRLHWEDGKSFDYCKEEDALLDQIRQMSPADVEGYKKFYKYSEAVFEEGYRKLGAVPFLNFWSMVKAAPQLTTLQAFRTVYGRVADFVKDEHLRQAFSFHTLLVGGDPHKTSSIYALIHALERDDRIVSRTCISAQHRGMLDQVLAIADITPDHDLDLMTPGQTLDELTAAADKYINVSLVPTSARAGKGAAAAQQQG